MNQSRTHHDYQYTHFYNLLCYINNTCAYVDLPPGTSPFSPAKRDKLVKEESNELAPNAHVVLYHISLNHNLAINQAMLQGLQTMPTSY